MEVIDAAGRGDLVDEAARIWAEATAARDGDGEVPGLEVSRPVIQEVLDRSARALLLIARCADGTAAGFAAVEPLAGRDGPVVRVTYIGVRPRLWGQGVGESLLREMHRRFTSAGYARAGLSVYEDNRRAIALYERLGWRPRGAPAAHPGRASRSGATNCACDHGAHRAACTGIRRHITELRCGRRAAYDRRGRWLA